jgi:hypothetical protein
MGAAAVNAIIAPWFVKARPAALASAYNGASIGGVVFSPLWVAAIGLLGFPGAAVAIGLVMVAAIWLLAEIYYSKKPEDLSLAPDGEAAAALATLVISPAVKPLPGGALWRDRSFVTLAGGMALGLFAQIGLLAHLFSLLVPVLGAHVAGLAASAAAASAIAGRTLFGWLMPAGADRRLFASASCAVQIAGSLVFLFAAGQDVPMLLLGVVLFGFGIGNGTYMPPLIAQAEFVKEDVTRVVPMIVAVSQGTYAFAPAVFGLIREFAPPVSAATPAATPYLFLTAAAMQAASIGCFLLRRRSS